MKFYRQTDGKIQPVRLRKYIALRRYGLLVIKSILAGVMVFGLVACSSASTEQVETSNTWQLSEVTDIGLEGVSPEIILEASGNFLLLTTAMTQQRAFSSKDGVAFTPVNVNLPIGSDYSIIQKADGSYLLYYVGFDMPKVDPNQNPGEQVQPNNSKKKVFVSSTNDLRTFTEPVFTGIEQSDDSPAWGVPDTYLDLSGNIKMMWVEMSQGDSSESLFTATSSDGISFTRDGAAVITGGYVDPYMLQVAPNDWILLLSTTPDKRKLPQKLFVAYSPDGENWQIEKEPLLTEDKFNYLDPAAVKTSDNTWRIIYSRADLDKAISGPHSYVSGVLKLTK